MDGNFHFAEGTVLNMKNPNPMSKDDTAIKVKVLGVTDEKIQVQSNDGRIYEIEKADIIPEPRTSPKM